MTVKLSSQAHGSRLDVASDNVESPTPISLHTGVVTPVVAGVSYHFSAYFIFYYTPVLHCELIIHHRPIGSLLQQSP